MDMKKCILLLSALCLLIHSCSKEEGVLPTPDVPSSVEEKVSPERKYLSFATRQDFNLYLKQIEEGKSGLRSARAYARYIPKGFKSVGELQQEQLRSVAIATTSTSVALPESERMVDTEMSETEFAVFRAEELLLDSTLRFALDTTLRVEIADTVYAVTEVGTFVAPVGSEDKLDRAIADFKHIASTSDIIKPVIPVATPDEALSQVGYMSPEERDRRHLEISRALATLEPGQVLPIGDNMFYIDSYGSVQNARQASGITAGSFPMVMEPTEPEMPAFHKDYNVKTYPWKEKTLVGKILNFVTGNRSISRENYFDEKHRVQLVVYDIHLGFFTTTGIKARQQYRRRFLGLKVWKEDVSEKMVVGFNQFHAEIQDKVFAHQLTNPVAIKTLNGFQSTINGQIANFVTRAYNNLDFIEDWAHEIAAIIPSFNFLGVSVTEGKVYDFLYNTPRKEFISLLHNSVDRWAITPARNQALKTYPRIGFFPIGTGKSNVYALGVSEYENIKGKNIRLNIAFGINLSFNTDGDGIISPFVPRTVKMQAFDMFVSAKRNGVWKGVRLVHNI